MLYKSFVIYDEKISFFGNIIMSAVENHEGFRDEKNILL